MRALRRALCGASAVFCGVLVCSLAAPGARADEWNKKTIVKVYEPIEIPGRVLGPGTYVFKLANSQADRHIVEIWSKNDRRLLDTIVAIPAYRMDVTGKTVMRFDERPMGTPEALAEWFYPGDNYGQEFVYNYEWPVHEASGSTGAASQITSGGK
jgi:hypothetical protein